MSLLSETELRRVESKYSQGITSAAVVKIFKSKGERFSEATLRKYVQLGLLPTSRRVGICGRHRGSSGLYPVIIVRLANEIKRSLENGATLEDVKLSTIGLTGEIQLVRRASDQLQERLATSVQKALPPTLRPAFKQALAKHKKSMEKEIRSLEALVARLGQKSKK